MSEPKRKRKQIDVYDEHWVLLDELQKELGIKSTPDTLAYLIKNYVPVAIRDLQNISNDPPSTPPSVHNASPSTPKKTKKTEDTKDNLEDNQPSAIGALDNLLGLLSA